MRKGVEIGKRGSERRKRLDDGYKGRVMLLCLVPMFFNCHAQDINITLDVNASAGLEEVAPTTLGLLPGTGIGLETLPGTAVFAITAYENLKVLVQVELADKNDRSEPLNISLAYLNNGSKSAIDAIAVKGGNAWFDLSNSALLIDRMKGHPNVLYAYLIVTSTTPNKNIASPSRKGNLNIKIEYN